MPSDSTVVPPRDETRHAIVLAAIKLIAEKGVEGASLRAINLAAGSRNSSAAHYHFGSKYSVIEEAVATLHAETAHAQEPLLRVLEDRAREGRPISVREVLEAVYLPFFGLVTRPEYGPMAMKFASRVLVESNLELKHAITNFVAPVMERAIELFRAALPDIPEETIRLRMYMTITTTIHSDFSPEALSNAPVGDLSANDPLTLAHTLFSYMSAAMSAPVDPLNPQTMTRMLCTLSKVEKSAEATPP